VTLVHCDASQLADIGNAGGEIKLQSGRQWLYENTINRYIR
jgi:xylose isomerase